MCKTNIILVGAGQLGSRYLQGLASVNARLTITVIDTSQEALAVADRRWQEAKGHLKKHEIVWSHRLEDAPKEADLAIIATSANKRYRIVENLASITSIQYWVLEKVLVQSVSELEAVARTLSSAKGCWVNTARRLMRWHQSLRNQVCSSLPLRLRYESGLWGLACNSIHFIDLAAWWSGETLVSIDTSGLDGDWFESKRPGFYEVTGDLIAYFSGGSRLVLSSHPEAKGQEFIVELAGEGGIWRIDEANGRAVGPAGAILAGQLDYQSFLTPSLVTAILQTGRCGLPTLQESSQMHAIYLAAMLDHWNQSHGRNDTILPIT